MNNRTEKRRPDRFELVPAALVVTGLLGLVASITWVLMGSI